MLTDTGFPQADAENDFLRARRREVAGRLGSWLRGEPDRRQLLSLEQVVSALGRRGERRLGLQTIRLDTIVGTLDARRDFDRWFRPASNRLRSRWVHLALMQRRGESLPPVEVYRVGGCHFVEDGHHRVSIARAARQTTIDAYVTEVRTAVPAVPPVPGPETSRTVGCGTRSDHQSPVGTPRPESRSHSGSSAVSGSR
jgi:hypothetical protein